MSCQCHQIGGPFIAEDPNCPYHGVEATQEREWTEERIAALTSALRGLLDHVVPHARDTGHNAADREMREAIQVARKLVKD